MTMRRLLNDLAAIEQHFAQISRAEGFSRAVARDWSPAVDIFETETDFVLSAEVPGLNSDEIDIQVVDRDLTLNGERNWEREAHAEHFHRLESAYGKFERKFSLSEQIDVAKIQAELDRGVLRVILPKRAENPESSKSGGRPLK